MKFKDNVDIKFVRGHGDVVKVFLAWIHHRVRYIESYGDLTPEEQQIITKEQFLKWFESEVKPNFVAGSTIRDIKTGTEFKIKRTNECSYKVTNLTTGEAGKIKFKFQDQYKFVKLGPTFIVGQEIKTVKKLHGVKKATVLSINDGYYMIQCIKEDEPRMLKFEDQNLWVSKNKHL